MSDPVSITRKFVRTVSNTMGNIANRESARREQNTTEQRRTEQNRTEENREEQSRAEQSRTEETSAHEPVLSPSHRVFATVHTLTLMLPDLAAY